MSGLGKFVGIVILIVGFIMLIVGSIMLLGLNTLLSGIGLSGQGNNLVKPAITLFTLISGGPIVLGSFVVMGFGELVFLVAKISKNLDRKIE